MPPPTTTYAKTDTLVSKFSDTEHLRPSWTTTLITKSYVHVPLHSGHPGTMLIYNLNNSLSDAYGTPHSCQPTLPPTYRTPTPNTCITSLPSLNTHTMSLSSPDCQQYLHGYYATDLPYLPDAHTLNLFNASLLLSSFSQCQDQLITNNWADTNINTHPHKCCLSTSQFLLRMWLDQLYWQSLQSLNVHLHNGSNCEHVNFSDFSDILQWLQWLQW